MKAHFTKRGGEYLLSLAATLVVVADAIHSPDSGAEGKVRAACVIDQVMAAARAAKFEQADILETMLAARAHATRLIPVFDALVGRVGSQKVVEIIQQGLASATSQNGGK
ncbi:MAG: hypothetical protein AB1807_15675 [Pseudomonadota bacterium]